MSYAGTQSREAVDYCPDSTVLGVGGSSVTEDLRNQIVALLPRLRRFACALTGDTDRGDDLVQETCVRALSKLDQWQRGTRLDSWLYRIAQNLWLDQIRAGKIRGERVDIDTLQDFVGDDGRKVTEGRLTLSAVALAIDQLPPEQKVLIALVCFEELSYKEAADVLEIPIGTVMSRLARARSVLYERTYEFDNSKAPIQLCQRRGRHFK